MSLCLLLMGAGLVLQSPSTLAQTSADFTVQIAARLNPDGRVESPEDLKEAFKRGIRATEEGQAALIEVITPKEIDYSVFR